MIFNLVSAIFLFYRSNWIYFLPAGVLPPKPMIYRYFLAPA